MVTCIGPRLGQIGVAADTGEHIPLPAIGRGIRSGAIKGSVPGSEPQTAMGLRSLDTMLTRERAGCPGIFGYLRAARHLP